MSTIGKTFEQYWSETENVRSDARVVALVRRTTSAESLNSAMEAQDYPTDLCREARLLYQCRERMNDFQEEARWRDVFRSLLPAEPKAITHRYPCEWENERYHGVVRGSMQAGTLVVEKNAAKAAVFWDYMLTDEDGEEVCHSRDLSRDSFLREGLMQVNCYPNCGSRLLPRTGLKITFSALVSALRFTRVKLPVEVMWERFLGHNDAQLPFIRRKARGEGRNEEHHSICAQILLEDYTPGRVVLKNEWGLFVTTSFLKRSSRVNGGWGVPTSTAPQSVLFDVESCYKFRGEDFAEYLVGRKKIFHAERFSNSHHTWKIGSRIVPHAEQSTVEGTYKPHEQSIEDVLLDIEGDLPSSIDCSATLEHMCDIRKMGVKLFRSTPDWNPGSSIFVKG